MNLVGRQVFRGPSLTFCRILAAKCSSQNPDLKGYIDTLVKKGPVVVFMKGTPDQPRCGFSNAVVQILRFHGVNQFDAYNVLQDEKLRQGVKQYTEWPTIPQIFMGGDFVGGCDILMDMHKSGELIEELKKVGIQSALLDKPDKDKA